MRVFVTHQEFVVDVDREVEMDVVRTAFALHLVFGRTQAVKYVVDSLGVSLKEGVHIVKFLCESEEWQELTHHALYVKTVDP